MPGMPGKKAVSRRRLVGAQNIQIWTASTLIGIQLTSTQIGGTARVLRDLRCHAM
jgi:hypothetical protein